MNPFTKLLPDYIEINERYDGNTIISFTASIAVHRKHTKKDLFVVQQVYSAVMFTDWEKVKTKHIILKEYAKNILKSLDGTARQGWYTDEEYIHGEYVDVKRFYNQWAWYDRKNNRVVGSLETIKEITNGTK